MALGKEHMPVLDQEQVLVLDHDLVCWMLAKSKWWFCGSHNYFPTSDVRVGKKVRQCDKIWGWMSDYPHLGECLWHSFGQTFAFGTRKRSGGAPG